MCPPKKYLTVQPNSTITIIITDPVIKMTLDPGCGAASQCVSRLIHVYTSATTV